MSDYEKKRDEAAETYSKEMFAETESFTVMNKVCNDRIFSEAFCAGADWANEWIGAELLFELVGLKAKLEIAKSALGAIDGIEHERGANMSRESYADTVQAIRFIASKALAQIEGEK